MLFKSDLHVTGASDIVPDNDEQEIFQTVQNFGILVLHGNMLLVS